ncbi:MAG TPA: PepSY domain-containing protein [Bacillota bacterium]|nr:PepSY domain-containing protein [Bacillota bacterium]
MNIRRVLLALGVGFAAGYVVKQQLNEYQSITPEEALEKAKTKFRRLGPINGSWIYMKPEQIERNGLLYDVYRGGITRNIDGENVQFDFYADIDSGTIIDTKQANV